MNAEYIAPIITAIGMLAVTLSGIWFKLRHIENSVNGSTTASATKMQALQKEIDDLKLRIASKDQTAALLAQTAAVKKEAPPALPMDVIVKNEPDAPVPIIPAKPK